MATAEEPLTQLSTRIPQELHRRLRVYCVTHDIVLMAARGWQAIEFVDQGVSGTKEKRPALDRLLREVKARRIDVVVVAAFDRFSRSVRHLIETLELFRHLGVEFMSLREQI